jgi:hypothetical protein
MKRFRFLHFLYAVIISGIILAEIAVITLYIIYQNRFKTEFVGKLQDSIANHYVGTSMNNSVSLSWDFVQFNFQCCGAISKNDYLQAINWNRTNPYQMIPFTCCPLGVAKNWKELPTFMTETDICAITGLNAYPQGCYDRLVDVLVMYKSNVLIGSIIVGIAEVFAFLFSVLLYCRKEDYCNF